MAPKGTKKRDSPGSPGEMNYRMELVSTPTQRSPTKQLKKGITLQQKQALIENLQLEITERARRLRAQYHLQAQGLRSRIEIRINRIPMALRKMRMEDLLLKYTEKEQRSAAAATVATTVASSRAPPVPAKDGPVRSPQKPTQTASQATRGGRTKKRPSDDINGDKENEFENTRKRVRGAQADTAPVRPGQVLSPTSSNSRLNNNNMRPASPTKSQIARPGSPLKSTSRTAAATTMLSNFVEKAKSSRAAGARKVTTASNTSSSSAGGTGPAPAAKTTRRAAAPSKPPTSRPATRMGRRGSVGSETSDGSTTTIVKKGAGAKGTTTKKVLGAFSKGTASGDAKKATASKTTPASTTRTGRVLRNRG